ncbi:MAG: DUF368 domain-containing protein [Anaerovoracaceae bacterium]
MEHFRTFIYGALIGIANAIPGVSGGTMAVILNIYHKILFAFSLKNIKAHLAFLIPLGVGALVGIFLLSNVIVSLMQSYPMVLNFCFIGLVLGSVPSIYKRAQDQKIKWRNLVLGLASLALMILLSQLGDGGIVNKSLAEMGGLDFTLWLWIFFAVLVSAVSMILPGISGSLVMLLFGVYTLVMEAISNFYFPLLLPIGLGALTGLFLGIKVIKKMLRFHPQALYFIILGLVVGSVFTIYPGFTPTLEGFISLTGMTLFGALAFFLCSRN